jgi:hypothetical protein
VPRVRTGYVAGELQSLLPGGSSSAAKVSSKFYLYIVLCKHIINISFSIYIFLVVISY